MRVVHQFITVTLVIAYSCAFPVSGETRHYSFPAPVLEKERNRATNQSTFLQTEVVTVLENDLESVPETQNQNKESIVQLLFNFYSIALDRYPFFTKGITSSLLCAFSDIIAQTKKLKYADQNYSTKLPARLDGSRAMKFAIKGFFETAVWSPWYDLSDRLLSQKNVVSLLRLLKITEFSGSKLSKKSLNNIRVVLLILFEQFAGSPLYYSAYEIPVSTLMNGAKISRIPYEIRTRLLSILFADLTLWTGANFIIYNAPLKHRAGISNLFSVLWQVVIMSDFSADCGH